jgi:CRP-like cAMP-binding protein
MTTFINILKQADIFYGMNATQLELVANLCTARNFESGQIIFDEGTSSDELYIIDQGEVDILVNPALVSPHPDQEYASATIATLRRGQSFGEIALVDRGMRSATARAAQPNTRLLELSSDRLMKLCDNHPEFGYRLMHNLAADLALKMRSTDLRIREELLYGSGKK